MPRRKKQSFSKSLLMKQKKNLTTRLIQISIKVEDHLYKNILISLDEAKSYYQELLAYEPKCRVDVRSMQVIEKLTRCMRAIISEHSGSDNTQNFSLSFPTGNYCVSPTYSEIDEDRTASDIIPPDSNNFMNVDLSVNESLDIGPVEIRTEVEIHRAMSNLSIKDPQDSVGPETDCSQSILKDFNNKSNHGLLKESNATKFDEKGKTQNIISRNNHMTLDKGRIIRTPDTDNIPDTSKNVIRTGEEIGNSENKNFFNINCTSITDDSKNNESKKTKRKRRTKEEILSDSFKKPQKVNKKTTSNKKNLKSCTKSNTTINENKLPCFKVPNNIYKANQRSSLITNTEEKKANNNLSEIPIYNKSVENDLSWMENIRFVREVASDDYDPKYSNISDDFWKNCTLPSFWDDNDFVF